MKNKKIKIIGLISLTIISTILLTGCTKEEEVRTYDKEQINISENLSEPEDTNKTIENSSEKENTSNNKEGKVTDVQFQLGNLDYKEYGIVHAYDAEGNEVWKYTTDSYNVAQYPSIGLLMEYGYDEESVIINDGGTIIKFDKQTGEILWKNADFQSTVAMCELDEDNNLYIVGNHEPNLFVINGNGETVKRMNIEGFYWPSEISSVTEENTIIIEFQGHPKVDETGFMGDYIAEVIIDLDNYSYDVKYIDVEE